MNIKEGSIPTALGAVVTTAGLISRQKAKKSLAWGVVGFGLAHVVLGGIDYFQHKDESF